MTRTDVRPVQLTPCSHWSKTAFSISRSAAWHLLHPAENIALETQVVRKHLPESSRAALLAP